MLYLQWNPNSFNYLGKNKLVPVIHGGIGSLDRFLEGLV